MCVVTRYFDLYLGGAAFNAETELTRLIIQQKYIKLIRIL